MKPQCDAVMPDLPTGTVTLLITDVEGSTELLKRLGDAYAEALDDQHRLLERAIALYGGVVVDTQGDSCLAAFARGRDAVAAAVEAQRALAAHPWPAGETLRVRMALHTGEPTVEQGRYVGLTVHRAARIMALGHGGQVLLSRSTASVVEDGEVLGVALRDLGEHDLKDIDRPERVYQLVADDLARDFPALRTGASERRSSRMRLVVASVTAALLAAAGAAALVLTLTGGDSSVTVAANSLVAVDPGSGKIVASIPVGGRPGPVEVGFGSAWVLNLDDDTVTRVDLQAKTVTKTISVGVGAADLTVGEDAVWVVVPVGGDAVQRLDPEFSAVTDTIALRIGSSTPFTPDPGANADGAIGAGAGAVWVAVGSGLFRVDASRRTAELASDQFGLEPESSPFDVATSAEAVWTTRPRHQSTVERAAGDLARYDAETGAVTFVTLSDPEASDIEIDGDSVWAVERNADRIVRVSDANRGIEAAFSVAGGPYAVVVTDGSLWVTAEDSGEILRLDLRTGEAQARIPVGYRPTGIAASDGLLWVTVQG